MWSDEELNDAVEILWQASQYGSVQKVTDKKQKRPEQYIIANNVAYTDPLYLRALDKLVEDHRLELLQKGESRQLFRRLLDPNMDDTDGTFDLDGSWKSF